jgi:hypothetical protein
MNDVKKDVVVLLLVKKLVLNVVVVLREVAPAVS